MTVNFEKIPFETFLKESKAAGFIDDWVNNELIYAVWLNIKPPTKKLSLYEIYSPWAFHVDENKQIILPTGYKAIIPEYYYLEYIPSDNFSYKGRIRNNKHIILKIESKKSICICEENVIAKCELVFE